MPERESEVVVFLKPGVQAQFAGATLGLKPIRAFVGRSDVWVFASNAESASAISRIVSSGFASSSFPVVATAYTRDGFTPNDPYFPANTPASGWPGEWTLLNAWTPGLDANLFGAWQRDVTGQGITIGIVDDGLEYQHPDISPNYSSANSFDFGQGDSDPSPFYQGDNHGTCVAGVAAARGGNGIGVTGAAPFASLSGLRIDFFTQTSAMFAEATMFHSIAGDHRIRVKNHSYSYSAPFVPTPLEAEALRQSAANGTVHCFSAGNNRGGRSQDSNKLMVQSDPTAITVTAINSAGTYSSYSNFGACVTVCAPSSGSLPQFEVTTTDRQGKSFGFNGASDTFPDADYTSRFGGTSAASPLVAGVIALLAQIEPHLDSRMTKHLLARTSRIVDPADASLSSDGGWKTNAAGFKFNQNYGFGLVDADALTIAAPHFVGVTPLVVESTALIPVGLPIPDGTGQVTHSFQIASSAPLEEMQLYVQITHPYRGDVEIYLTSPSGTTSRMIGRSGMDGGANIDWTFTSNAFWGENPQGTWQISVRDVLAPDAGTWNSFRATARMGSLIPSPIITGRVNLEALGANPAGQVVQFEIRPQDSLSSVIKKLATLDSTGNFQFEVDYLGLVSISAKTTHWLRQTTPSRELTASGFSGLDFILTNGDVDGDNEVTLSDYSRLALAFGSMPGDSNWDENADLNGDDQIGLDDFAILSNNFGQIGDN